MRPRGKMKSIAEKVVLKKGFRVEDESALMNLEGAILGKGAAWQTGQELGRFMEE